MTEFQYFLYANSGYKLLHLFQNLYELRMHLPFFFSFNGLMLMTHR